MSASSSIQNLGITNPPDLTCIRIDRYPEGQFDQNFALRKEIEQVISSVAIPHPSILLVPLDRLRRRTVVMLDFYQDFKSCREEAEREHASAEFKRLLEQGSKPPYVNDYSMSLYSTIKGYGDPDPIKRDKVNYLVMWISYEESQKDEILKTCQVIWKRFQSEHMNTGSIQCMIENYPPIGSSAPELVWSIGYALNDNLRTALNVMDDMPEWTYLKESGMTRHIMTHS